MNIAGLLAILDIVLSAVKGLIPGKGGTIVSLSDTFVRIAQAAASAYQAEVGQPLDLSKIPPETPLPPG